MKIYNPDPKTSVTLIFHGERSDQGIYSDREVTVHGKLPGMVDLEDFGISDERANQSVSLKRALDSGALVTEEVNLAILGKQEAEAKKVIHDQQVVVRARARAEAKAEAEAEEAAEEAAKATAKASRHDVKVAKKEAKEEEDFTKASDRYLKSQM